GNFLPNGTQPEPCQPKPPDDWSPYSSHLEFELADFIYTCSQISAANLNTLLELWATSLVKVGGKLMFGSYKEMYWMIDNTHIGNVKWQLFTVKYTGDVVANPAPWMHDKYDVWFQDPHEVVWNMLANPKFANNMDLQPFHEYNTTDSTWQWQDFMSGDWAWCQTVSVHLFIFSLPLSKLEV
ncbi:hypothetical protein PISMIDRAFT_106656, partial [Pisolithus microcarpus 441]